MCQGQTSLGVNLCVYCINGAYLVLIVILMCFTCASYAAGIDDCTPDSCSNGGQCEDGHQTFTCNCEGTGFTGHRCQTGKCA